MQMRLLVARSRRRAARAASRVPRSVVGRQQRARPSSSSSVPSTPRAAYRRASSGCTPACSSAQAVRGGIVAGDDLHDQAPRSAVPPASAAGRTGARPARTQRRAAATPKRARAASPHSVSVTAAPRASAVEQAVRSRRRRAPARPRAQAAPSSRSARRAQGVGDRRAAPRGRRGEPGSAPRPRTRSELTGSAPRASRASFTGCV